jgi:hypothetical protein
MYTQIRTHVYAEKPAPMGDPTQFDMFGFSGITIPRCQRSRVSNDVRRRHRGTTADGRRLRDLLLGFMDQLGNPVGVAVQSRVLAAAQLVLLVEKSAVKIIEEGGDPNGLVQLQNAADRALRRLGLSTVPTEKTQPAPLRERLAGNLAPSEPSATPGGGSLRERLAASGKSKAGAA